MKICSQFATIDPTRAGGAGESPSREKILAENIIASGLVELKFNYGTQRQKGSLFLTPSFYLAMKPERWDEILKIIESKTSDEIFDAVDAYIFEGGPSSFIDNGICTEEQLKEWLEEGESASST